VLAIKRFKEIDPITIEEPATNLFKKLGKEIGEISFLGKGEGSALFKITTQDNVYALKTALFPERTQKILNEAKIRDNFIEKGVQCVPAPKYVDQEFFKNGAVLFDFIDGVNSNYKDEVTIKKMARNLADIHKVNYELIPDGLEQMKKNHLALKKTMNHIEIDYPHLMNDSISEAFSLALDEYENLIEKNKDLFYFGISGILHGDIGGHFITDSQGKLWLVDWENSEYGDIVEEICTFVIYSDIEKSLQETFFKEYKIHFPPASDLDLAKIGYYYVCVMPAFNLCWGMDQLDTNLVHKLEPERKLLDINASAKNWKKFFSKETSSLIQEGVSELTLKLVNENNLCL
jgi:thiamine kinase-like enzyme